MPTHNSEGRSISNNLPLKHCELPSHIQLYLRMHWTNVSSDTNSSVVAALPCLCREQMTSLLTGKAPFSNLINMVDVSLASSVRGEADAVVSPMPAPHLVDPPHGEAHNTCDIEVDVVQPIGRVSGTCR